MREVIFLPFVTTAIKGIVNLMTHSKCMNVVVKPVIFGLHCYIALDLMSGYWQVEMDEAFTSLMAFTVGPLGFHGCDYMPFGLVNAPATFKRLIETCLGDLQLNWCLIYLHDINLFLKLPKYHIVQLRQSCRD